MLEGRKFTIFTDHKPLTQALHRTSDPWTARQCWQLSYVAEFTSNVQHISGKDNIVADTLSRPPPPQVSVESVEESDAVVSQGAIATVAAAVCDHLQPGLDNAAIAGWQLLCQETQQLLKFTSLCVKTVPVKNGQLYCYFSSGSARPLIPAADRCTVLNLVHSLAHPGICATKRLLSKRGVWRGMATDAAKWCRDCQHAKVQVIPVPDRQFSHLHVDLVGPLPTSATGFRYIMTIIDRSTRWLEAVPLVNLDAATCADSLIAGWISRFGVPSVITTTGVHSLLLPCGH
jgi:Integrase zinc binding domain